MTPALLLRSGIGPAAELRALGVGPVADLPEVGRHLYDQPGAVVPCVPAPGTEATDAVLTRLIARLAAIPGYPEDHAFYLNLFTGPDPYEGRPVSAIMVGDMYPQSRGTVTLTSADPAAPPAVDLGFYSAAGDLDRMRAVDEHCRVHGVPGLRVADLSIVPVPLRAPTALDAMMLGEHVAGWF